MDEVKGTQDVINNLMMARNQILQKIVMGIEKTAVQVANHAKSGHEGGGLVAHSKGRYANVTGNLTASITQKLDKVSIDEITAIIFSTMEYAPYVELGTSKHAPFPFLYPALIANAENLRNNVKQALGW